MFELKLPKKIQISLPRCPPNKTRKEAVIVTSVPVAIPMLCLNNLEVKNPPDS